MPDSHPHDLAELARMGPRPDIRLIATDMDGTLVDDEKQIHDELWPLIDELHARGITFCPASGRQYFNLVQEFEGVADELVFIAENGTYVVAHGKEISSDCLALDVAQQVVSRVRGVSEAGAVLCGKRSAYIERRDPRFVDQARAYYTRLKVVGDLLEVDDDVLKVAIYDFASAEHNTAPRLAGLAGSHQVVVSGAHWVDVMSPTANKGRAVRQVQETLGSHARSDDGLRGLPQRPGDDGRGHLLVRDGERPSAAQGTGRLGGSHEQRERRGEDDPYRARPELR